MPKGDRVQYVRTRIKNNEWEEIIEATKNLEVIGASRIAQFMRGKRNRPVRIMAAPLPINRLSKFNASLHSVNRALRRRGLPYRLRVEYEASKAPFWTRHIRFWVVK